MPILNLWKWTFAIALLLLLGCQSEAPNPNMADPFSLNWQEIEAQARGSEVTMMMWQGDPLINAYMRDYVIPEVRERFEIDLKIVSGQGSAIVRTLMNEMEAGKSRSGLDMVWINGETFYQLRQIEALYGPFVDSLPNSRYLDRENPFIAYDFQQPVNGWECPWGNVQMTWIYNSEQVLQPPQNLEALKAWVKAHPGKFTIGNNFTGMTLLKAWLIHLAGGKGSLDGPFDEQKYEAYSDSLWNYLREIRPYLWNQGQSFPSSLAQMHQLFANGELWFTMSNNDAEVDNKIGQGVFPEHSRAYVPSIGTIQNSHYLGIVKRATQKAGALVVINFLISPEAQFQKLQPEVWGDGSVLAEERLPTDWQRQWKQVPGRRYAPDRDRIQPFALREPAPEYMIRLYEDFRAKVIEQ